MKYLKEFKDLLDGLKECEGSIKKIEYLKKYQNNEPIKNMLNFIFNPYIITGFSKKKFNKDVSRIAPNIKLETTLDVMNYIKNHNSGRDIDISNIQEFIRNNIDYKDIIYALICKDLTIGLNIKGINKAIPNLIPEFEIMLAEKYFDNPEKYLPQNIDFIITTKLDGQRNILIFDENKEPHFFSRNGKEIEGMEDIREECKIHLNPDYIYDGELLANAKGESKEVYKQTVSIANSKGKKSDLIYNIFDRILKDDFVKKGCSLEPCYLRKAKLESELNISGLKFLKNVPILYFGKDQSNIEILLKQALNKGEEGIMINIANAPYECKRTKNILKVKVFNECEAYVIGLEEGEGRNSRRLGNIIVKIKDKKNNYHIVRCGSGFNDKQRELYWINPELIKDKIVELSYFEVTTNKDDDSLSLRFPIWLDRIREDKDLDSMNSF